MKDRMHYINQATEAARKAMDFEMDDENEFVWQTDIYDYYVIVDERGWHACGMLYSGRWDDPLASEVQLGTWLTADEAKDACARHSGEMEGEALYWEDRTALDMKREEAQHRAELPYEEPEGWMT